MRNRFSWKIVVLIALWGMAIIWGISKGAVNLRPEELFLESNRQILYLRLGRILLAMLAGSGLAVSGIVLQALLRNPLADPYLLGTSSGAGLAAVIAILFGIAYSYVPFVAFIGAMLSIMLVYQLSRQNGRITVQSLILSGVIVSIGLSSLIMFVLSTSERETLPGVTWWLWGNLEVFDLSLFMVVAVVVIVGIAVVYLFAQDLNAISIGDEEALHLGIDVEKTKKVLLGLTALITAALICICGIIGFVGLIIPHMARLIIGPHHRRLIPVSCLIASAFMVVCDVIARTVFLPSEVPIGVMTALVGAPLFIILLRRNQKVRPR